MFEWLKRLKRIVDRYDRDRATLNDRLSRVESRLRDQTTVAADVGYRQSNYVILVGRYRNNDYVQTFELKPEDFNSVVNALVHLHRTEGSVRVLDAPPVLRAVFNREVGRSTPCT